MTAWPSFDQGFSTPEMTELLSPERRVAALLRFEAALALAHGDAGVAPLADVERVAAACEQPLDEPEAILDSTWEAGTPLIAIIDQVKARLDDDRRQWVHYGATTQDAVDTAQMLLASEALGLLEDGLASLARTMRRLVEEHRDQPQMARTFLQHARPSSFGFRVACWLEPTLRHLVRLGETRGVLPVQLGGPVGNLAGLGPAAVEVVEALARRLGLRAPGISWHTDRSPIWELAEVVGAPVRTLDKVATDVVLLAQSDTAEIEIRGGGSSSMSHKSNPIDAIRGRAAAEVCAAAVGMITGSRPQELDRAVGSWHVEWLALPLMFHSAAAVFESMDRCLQSLRVRAEAMTSRVTVPGDAHSDAAEIQIDRILSRCQQVLGG